MWYLDLISTLFSLMSTYCFVKADIRMWPLAMIATLFNTCLYFYAGMFATMTLEISYLSLSTYGWFYWLKQSSSRHHIKALDRQSLLVIMGTCLLLASTIYVCNIKHLDGLIMWDIAAVSISLLAQWLTCRKIITCWYLWFVADSIYIALMLSKDLYFHTCLFSIYLIMAILGFLNWLKLYRLQENIFA